MEEAYVRTLVSSSTIRRANTLLAVLYATALAVYMHTVLPSEFPAAAPPRRPG